MTDLTVKYGSIKNKEKKLSDQKEFIKVNYATHTPWVLIDAVHAQKPRHDKYTGELAEFVAERTGCHCIIATVSRTDVDLNRAPVPNNKRHCSAIEEYRCSIKSMLQSGRLLESGKLRHPFLHLALHGMKDSHGIDIDLGTRYGKTCSPLIRNWIYTAFKQNINSLFWHRQQPEPVLDRCFPGDPSKSFHCGGTGRNSYPGYGENYNTVQIECAYWLRSNHRTELVDILCQVIGQFRRDFCQTVF